MSNIVLIGSEEIAQRRATMLENKEWPFDGYLDEINRLEKHLGQKFIFSLKTGLNSGINSPTYTPMGLFLINPEYIHPEQKNPLYPHSVVLSDGNAINMREIILIAKEELRGKVLFELSPWKTAASGRKDNLSILNSEGVVYRNLPLYAKLTQSSKECQEMISEMVKEGVRVAGFDYF